MLLVNLLIYLLVVSLILWLILYLVRSLAPAEFHQPVKVTVMVIFVIICIYALAAVLGGAPFHAPLLLR